MNQGSLAVRLAAAFDTLSPQLQAAARYVLDHPREVALLSMREQARQAGVQPATMTRLAKAIGLDGYEPLRQAHADGLRGQRPGFADKADVQRRRQELKGDHALAAEMLSSLSAEIDRLTEPPALESLVAAAQRLALAQRVFCLGLRSSHPAAWQLHYILSLTGANSVLLDSAAGIGADAIASATSKDVLLAVAVAPYTRLTVEIADYARERGVPIVAVTDSVVSPLAKLASVVVLVPTDSPSFFHTMAPAFAVAEVLGALVAGRGGMASRAALERTEHQLAALNVFRQPGGPAAGKFRSKA